MPVAIEESYFLELNEQGGIPAGAGYFAELGRSPELQGAARQKFQTLVGHSPAPRIRSVCKDSHLTGGAGNGYFA